jgi:hypothetical protein
MSEAVVSSHCMVSALEISGKARNRVRSRYSQETCQLFLHFKIGLRVIVGAKLYLFCIAFQFDLFARHFCWILQNHPKHLGLIAGFVLLFFPDKACCEKISSTVLFQLHAAFG